MRRPPTHFRDRSMLGGRPTLCTIAAWLADGYEVAPQGPDWLDPDDEYGRRGPIFVTRQTGAGVVGDGVDMRRGDVYDDPDDETEDEAEIPAAATPPRVFREGPAWDALVKAGHDPGKTAGQKHRRDDRRHSWWRA